MIDTPEHFRTTQWSIVLTARKNDSTQARAAMEKLCHAYWPPIYAFVRRRGHAVQDAQDLTQEFFARLLDKGVLDHVDPARGKFRSFLLASIKHFLTNEWDKANAQKRGGGKIVFPIDIDRAETRYTAEPIDDQTPEKIFERQWAIILLNHVLQHLQDEYVCDAKAKLFEELKPALAGDRQADAYAQIAARLDMTEGAVKTAVHRLRQRYRDLLRAHIGDTVSDPGEVDDEIRALFSAVQ